MMENNENEEIHNFLNDSNDDENKNEEEQTDPLFISTENGATKSNKKGEVYKCNVCSKAFKRNDILKKHMITHLEIKPFGCEVCSKSFGREDHLRRHSQTHVKQQIKEHLEVERSSKASEAYLKCTVCSKEIKRKENMRIHMLTHAKQDLKIERSSKTSETDSKCTICSKGIKRKNMKKHMLTHGKQHFKVEPTSKTLESGSKCTVCSKEIKRKNMKKHLLTHAKQHLKVEPSSKTSETHSRCTVCSKEIKRKNMKKHMVTHTDYKPFGCQVCTRTFRRKDQLDKHKCQQVNGTMNEIAEIDNCTVDSSETDLKSAKLHKCLICLKFFKRKDYLNKHMIIHSDIKPFSCTVCSKPFGRRDHMQKHFQSHFKDDGLSETESDTYLDVVSINTLCQPVIDVLEDENVIISFNDCENEENNGEIPFNDCENEENNGEILFNDCENEENQGDISDQIGFFDLFTPIEESTKNSSRKRFECAVCLKDFARKDRWKKHMSTHSDMTPFSEENNGEISFNDGENEENEGEISFINFENEENNGEISINNCENEENNGEVSDQMDFFTLSTLPPIQGSTKKSNRKTRKCAVCLREFSRKDRWKKHMSTHSHLRLFNCKVKLVRLVQKSSEDTRSNGEEFSNGF